MKPTILACALLGSRFRALIERNLLNRSACQTAAPCLSGGATAAGALKVRGEIRWQQVTPMVLSSSHRLRPHSAVDIEWWPGHVEKPELGCCRPTASTWLRALS